MEDALRALLRLLPLDQLPRTGWLLRGVPDPESIAGHSLGAAFCALALAPRVEPPLDVDRVVALCVVHDAPEAESGDLPRSASRALPEGAKAAMESTLADGLLTPLAPAARARFAEYSAAESREARLARLCDKLQLGVRLLGYREAGRGGLEEFVLGLESLDCSEFAPAEELRTALLERLASPESEHGSGN
jgi:5'-deoxynucleotidase YfbR-like HD superfamily hydrolase